MRPKVFLLGLSLLLLSINALGQGVDITLVSDTIYANEKFIGYIVKNGSKLTAIVGNSDAKWIVQDQLHTDNVVIQGDLVLNFEKNSGTIKNYKGYEVGRFVLVKKILLPAELHITMYTRDYHKKAIKNYYFNSAMYFLNSKIVIKYSEEDYKAKRREELALKKLKQKQKIERFYAQVFERLKGNIDPIEGIYKSVNLGESFEYDIAILKSSENSRKYVSLVLASTDRSLQIGSNLFTFVKTAQNNLFFVDYQLKSGQSIENKTAVLNGAILEMGIKSFIKMYPSEGDSREYKEANPLYDWEASGSGVLINKSGYLVTNNHVIEGSKRIRVAFQNDTIDYNAVIISQNDLTDVAVLKIEDDRFESNVQPIKWQTDFRLGQKVFTLGYPISDKMSDNVKVVDGIVSGMNGREGNPLYFQTTLPVWYGNSGGPCFNEKGEVLGLATQILWDKGAKVDNVAYITKTENILKLAGNQMQTNSANTKSLSLEELIEDLVPYSVFIKVNF